MVTTFETAARLKSAGFPQPEPKWGQIWYGFDDANTPVVITCEKHDFGVELALPCDDANYYLGLDNFTDPNPNIGYMVFAPGPADLLQKMFRMINHSLSHSYALSVNVVYWEGSDQWTCEILGDLPLTVVRGHGKTLADSYADALLGLIAAGFKIESD